MNNPNIKLSLVMLVSLFILIIPFGLAQTDSDKVTVYFFWGEGCPHCATEKPFLEELEQKYPEVEIQSYETWKNPDNAQLLREVAEGYGITARGVPTTFIGEEHWVGYADYMKSEMEAKVSECIEDGCEDPAKDIISPDEKTDVPDTEKDGSDDQTKQPSDNQNPTGEVCVHVFLDYKCGECDATKKYLDSLDMDDIDIMYHNVDEEDEKKLYDTFKETYGLNVAGYPSLFVGDNYLIGLNSIKNHFKDTVDDCRDEGCPCPVNKIKGFSPSMPQGDFKHEERDTVKVPFLGHINIAKMPSYLFTSFIAFIDGFNPCSLWLITFLLGIVIYSNSRKKVLAVGGTFLLVTGIAYALFMVGLLNVFFYVGYLGVIQVIVALIAFIFAAVNIKDYFWYKKGISFTIPDRFKPRIFKNLRSVMRSDKTLLGSIIGTALLALGVVLVELPCTAGFPLVWTNMMAQQQIQGLAFILLLLLYMVIYLSIEILIIIAALITMKTAKFEEKHGRVLKLIGGMIMLALALVMLIDPNLMNNIGTTVLIFGSAILAALLVLFVHRRLLPKKGIYLGTERLDRSRAEEKEEKKNQEKSDDETKEHDDEEDDKKEEPEGDEI